MVLVQVVGGRTAGLDARGEVGAGAEAATRAGEDHDADGVVAREPLGRVEQLAEDSREMFSDLILAQSFPDAMRRVRAHRAAGHRTLLITGALDVVIEPLRPLFDDIVCARLGVHDGRYTGELTDVPPTGETRAASLARYAAANDLSLSDAVAYADSTSDLPMLEAVGFPVAVNPEPKLASLARRRGWLVELWERAPGSPRKLLPLGPERTRP